MIPAIFATFLTALAFAKIADYNWHTDAEPWPDSSNNHDLTFGNATWAELPILFQHATRAQDAGTIEQIRNTLALYALIVDAKAFDQLDLVLSGDVVANYSEPLGVLTPLSAVQAGLEQSLAPVKTQHSYGTQVIEVLDKCSARSLTYATATHFGQGEHEGQILTAYNQYRDVWALTSRGWRISRRTLTYMGPLIGNVSIFL